MGKCNYGYTDFYLDITGLVRPGENLIQVNTMNGMNNISRWYTGSGIYRNVNLIVADGAYFVLGELRVTTMAVDGKTVLKVTGEVACQTGALAAALTVTGPDGQAVSAGAEVDNGAFATEIEIADPALWSPDHPALYTLKAVLSSGNEDRITFGIRTIRVVPGRGLLLNGETIKLRGGAQDPEDEGNGLQRHQRHVHRNEAWARSSPVRTETWTATALWRSTT